MNTHPPDTRLYDSESRRVRITETGVRRSRPYIHTEQTNIQNNIFNTVKSTIPFPTLCDWVLGGYWRTDRKEGDQRWVNLGEVEV